MHSIIDVALPSLYLIF